MRVRFNSWGLKEFNLLESQSLADRMNGSLPVDNKLIRVWAMYPTVVAGCRCWWCWCWWWSSCVAATVATIAIYCYALFCFTLIRCAHIHIHIHIPNNRQNTKTLYRFIFVRSFHNSFVCVRFFCSLFSFGSSRVGARARESLFNRKSYKFGGATKSVWGFLMNYPFVGGIS